MPWKRMREKGMSTWVDVKCSRQRCRRVVEPWEEPNESYTVDSSGTLRALASAEKATSTARTGEGRTTDSRDSSSTNAMIAGRGVEEDAMLMEGEWRRGWCGGGGPGEVKEWT